MTGPGRHAYSRPCRVARACAPLTRRQRSCRSARKWSVRPGNAHSGSACRPANAYSGTAGRPGNAHRGTAGLFATSDWTATLRRRTWPCMSARSVRWPPVTSLNARTLSKASSGSTAVVSPLASFADRPSPTSINPPSLPRLITPALLLPL